MGPKINEKEAEVGPFKKPISILPPCSIHGVRGSRKTSCDGLADKVLRSTLTVFDAYNCGQSTARNVIFNIRF